MHLNEFILSQTPVLPSIKMPRRLFFEVDEERSTEVRAPERLNRFQLAAELAYARAEQKKHQFWQKRWWKATCRTIMLRPRLHGVAFFGQSPDQMEPSFHSGALQRALLLGDVERGRRHAARLQELIPGRSSLDFMEDTMSWLAEEAAPEGVLGYAKDHFILFRRRPRDLRLTLQPMSEKEAHDLLARLRLGRARWEDLSTSSCACVYPAISLRSGQKVWIELSLEGYWVCVGCSNGDFAFEHPFPRFEEAALYLHGPLMSDLDRGLKLSNGWISAE